MFYAVITKKKKNDRIDRDPTFIPGKLFLKLLINFQPNVKWKH
jgi:hypothetical protein